MATQTQVSPNNERIIRYALRGNGVFSSISGALFTLASAGVANFLGIADTSIFGLFNGATFILIIGIGLLVFAGGLFFNSARKLIDRTQARAAVLMDIGWIVASAIILLTSALPLTTAGSWTVLIVADITLVFTGLQYYGLRRMQAQGTKS